MAVRTITTRLAVDGETAFKKAMAEVNASLRAIRSEMELSEAQFRGHANSIEALTAKDKLLREEIAQQIVKVRALEQAMRDAAQVYGENSAQADRYRAQINHAKAELVSMNQALAKHTQYMKEAREDADHTARSIDGFGNSTAEAESSVNTLASALAAAGVAHGISEITGAIIDCTKASTQFQSDITGVFKTVEGSDRQLAEIRDGIKQMTTEIPATTTAISKVAETAGQLGIARENILDFTRVMIDLDETTDMTAENGAKSLARFANVTRMQAENYSRLGSTIVALGNNFATSESEITAMGTRLAAAGTLAKMTQPEILALGAAMSSVGIEAEAGGTAMTQTLTAIEKAVTEGGEKLDGFARIAGMSAEEFSTAWRSGTVTAVQAFISGLGELDAQGESATLVLDELGLSGVRQGNMLKSLALASDQMTGAIDLANRAWEENNALSAEAAKRYSDDAVKLQIFHNAANNAAVAVGDVLRPALGELAEAGADGFQWAAEFIEKNPWLIQALTGVTAALAIFTGGVVAYKTATAAAKVAQDALSASAALNPVFAATAVITGFIVATRTYTASLRDAEEKTQALTTGLEESRRAYEETGEALRKESGDVVAMADALEELAGVENKSAVQKAAMADLVAELNEAVPGLTLAYDAQTDSLNMTGEAIRSVAQAEAERRLRQADYDRLVELYQEQAATARELAEAENRLRDAEAELNTMIENGTRGAVGYEIATSAAEQAVVQAKKGVKELTAAQEENRREAAALEETFDSTVGTVEDFSHTSRAAAEAAEEQAKFLKELERTSRDLAASVDTLAKAMKEQAQDGDLSLKTALDLIEAGYGAALAIDTETGAVTLNKAAYIELATAKINDQIASLEAQRQSEQNRARLEEETRAAGHLGSAYWEAAVARAAADKGDTTAIDAQIAALKQARTEIQSFTGVSETAGRASSSRAKKVQTEAERDLVAYKELRAELDHRKAVDLVTERDYYIKLKEYRDRYLTDEGNLSEYRRVTEQIYKYDRALADSEAALWAEQTEALTGELEDRVKGIESQRQGMERALSGYGELFTVKNDRMSLESIQEQIDAIDRYEAAMARLRERGLSQDLLDEVLAMNVDEATEYGEQLLAMSDAQWEQYNALWDEKQLRAAQVAEQFYKDQLQELETEYKAKLDQALDGLTDTAFQSGADTAKGLIDGLASQEEALYAKARAMEQKVAEILKSAWRDIPSNAEIAASLNPEALRTEPPATARDVRQAVSAGVNGIQTAFAGIESETPSAAGDVYLDSQKVGRILLPGLRAEAKANPEVRDDT